MILICIVLSQDNPTSTLSIPKIIPLEKLLIRDTAHLTFKWHGSENSKSYDLHIQPVDNLENTLIFNMKDTLMLLPEIPIGHYIWKVRAVNNKDKSDWSAENEFYINPTLIFSNTYGTDQNEKGMDLILCPDGGYLLIATSKHKDTRDMDAWVVKTDSVGVKEWEKRIDREQTDEVNAAVLSNDNHLYLSGKIGNSEYSKVWIIKLTLTGEIIWERTIYDTGFNWANDVIWINDHIIVTGYFSNNIENSTDKFGTFLMGINVDGKIIWEKKYSDNYLRISRSFKPLKSGGVIMTGSIRSNDADDSNCWVAALSTEGEIIWENQFGGPGEDIGHDISPTLDGGYIITGMTKSIVENISDLWLIKTDKLGIEEWTRTFHESGYHWGNSVVAMKTGEYLISGYTQIDMFSDLIYFQTDKDGVILWKEVIGGAKFDFARVMHPTTDGGNIILGTTCSYGAGLCDVWLVKTDRKGRTVEVPSN